MINEKSLVTTRFRSKIEFLKSVKFTPGGDTLDRLRRLNPHWLIFFLLLLRFGPVGEYLLSGHTSWTTQGIVMAGTYTLNAVFIFVVWDRRYQFHLKMPSRRQVYLWGFGGGVFLLIVMVSILWRAKGIPPQINHTTFIIVIILHAIVQFLNAAALEEPLFRGFLWGYFKERGHSDWLTLFTQATLFFLAHWYYASPGMYIHWGRTFITALFTGVAAWRTRSILPGMIIHAIGNCASMLF